MLTCWEFCYTFDSVTDISFILNALQSGHTVGFRSNWHPSVTMTCLTKFWFCHLAWRAWQGQKFIRCDCFWTIPSNIYSKIYTLMATKTKKYHIWFVSHLNLLSGPLRVTRAKCRHVRCPLWHVTDELIETIQYIRRLESLFIFIWHSIYCSRGIHLSYTCTAIRDELMGSGPLLHMAGVLVPFRYYI